MYADAPAWRALSARSRFLSSRRRVIASASGSLPSAFTELSASGSVRLKMALMTRSYRVRWLGVLACASALPILFSSSLSGAAVVKGKATGIEKLTNPVWEKAKDAAGQLKKLGVGVVGSIPAAPILDRVQGARIEAVLRQGLRAEIAERYVAALRLYQKAHRMDPADPTPLRYLGELYRHHTGEWDKARAAFNTILNIPADAVARAVALHGLGKMTIHDGEFKKGLSLMEQSVAEFPLALAYRNLAVYWNSEGDLVQGTAYTKKALALDPKDPYNLVFAAVFMAASGNGDEALKIARENRNLLPASYNLAAIFAQTGHRREALALLQRHFFRYERYQAVRAKEMMEARVDAVFDSLRQDSAFLALTSGADGKLQMPMRNMTGTQNR